MEQKKISISDQPAEAGGDQLGNDRYADALVKFMNSSDTPITIGIQGGWGSGKTTLLNFITNKVQDSMVVKLNAWEFSLFHEKGVVAFSLLQGLVEELKKEIELAHKLKKISDETRKIALNLPSLKQIAAEVGIGLLGKLAKTAINAGTAGIVNSIGGNAEAESNLAAINSHGSNSDNGVTSIKELRTALEKAIKAVIDDESKSVKRIVFMIDDLDRIDPTVALDVLDVLKNVMEIRDCVFVLAIDYDVVVKGLKIKFGEKTNENAREFRQYFDKIIQVPFSMPVSAYRDNIDTLLGDLFQRIGIEVETQRLECLSEYAWKLTDGAPRSIKRIVNMLSLLRLLTSENRGGDDLEILFVFVCLQINFPLIFNKIASSPDYMKWTLDNAQTIEWSKLDDAEKEISKNKAFDDKWEQALYLLCRKDVWTQQRAVGLSEILGDLYKMRIEPLTKTEDGTEEKSVGEVLATILTAVSVTNIGDEIQLEQNHRQDQISKLCLAVAEALKIKGNDYARKKKTTRFFWLSKDSYDIKITFNEDSGAASNYSIDFEITVQMPPGKIRAITAWLKSPYAKQIGDFEQSAKWFDIFSKKNVFSFALKDLKDNLDICNKISADLDRNLKIFDRKLNSIA